jgi:5-methylcytosine-specific restriction endonuclease McrA
MASKKTTDGAKLTITQIKRARSPHQPVGRWIRPDARLSIYLRDGFRCLLCTTDLTNADPRDITLDHVKPKVDGGSNDPSNLYTCCRSCNCSRQDLPLSRFAGPEARKHIARNCKRSMARYRKLARALISGETGMEETLKGVSLK